MREISWPLKKSWKLRWRSARKVAGNAVFADSDWLDEGSWGGFVLPRTVNLLECHQAGSESNPQIGFLFPLPGIDRAAGQGPAPDRSAGGGRISGVGLSHCREAGGCLDSLSVPSFPPRPEP